MNIYLDVDGVLLNHDGTLANHADEFLAAMVHSCHPVHWLTGSTTNRCNSRTKNYRNAISWTAG